MRRDAYKGEKRQPATIPDRGIGITCNKVIGLAGKEFASRVINKLFNFRDARGVEHLTVNSSLRSQVTIMLGLTTRPHGLNIKHARTTVITATH